MLYVCHIAYAFVLAQIGLLQVLAIASILLQPPPLQAVDQVSLWAEPRLAAIKAERICPVGYKM